ncbi:hypothetical protein HYC85_030324 [Camellia sinensis]|uniref:Uncharacterized protein n=1 Tax=Camellia sinensis TaxID=4442 RepID=A0A7J7G0E6_CAMSI|nr:hypothetical protein HYC85_030324 [Camellia sinensis]
MVLQSFMTPPSGVHPFIQQDLSGIVTYCVMSLQGFTLPCTNNTKKKKKKKTSYLPLIFCRKY